MSLDGEGLPLSIEAVNLIIFCAVEALVWEIGLVSIRKIMDDRQIMVRLDSMLIELRDTYHSLVFYMPIEMVVFQSIVVEKHDEYLFILNKTTCDVGVRKLVNRRGPIIYSKNLIEADLVPIDGILVQLLLLVEKSHPELSIYVVTRRKLVSPRVLNTLFDLDIVAWLTTIPLRRQPLLVLDRILHNKAFGIILLLHAHSSLGVVRDEHTLDVIFCHDRVCS